MKLDRTKRYKVGRVVFHWAVCESWVAPMSLSTVELTDDDLARLCPVELKETTFSVVVSAVGDEWGGDDLWDALKSMDLPETCAVRITGTAEVL